jgi:hypothetical protein
VLRLLVDRGCGYQDFIRAHILDFVGLQYKFFFTERHESKRGNWASTSHVLHGKDCLLTTDFSRSRDECARFIQTLASGVGGQLGSLTENQNRAITDVDDKGICLLDIWIVLQLNL